MSEKWNEEREQQEQATHRGEKDSGWREREKGEYEEKAIWNATVCLFEHWKVLKMPLLIFSIKNVTALKSDITSTLLFVLSMNLNTHINTFIFCERWSARALIHNRQRHFLFSLLIVIVWLIGLVVAHYFFILFLFCIVVSFFSFDFCIFSFCCHSYLGFIFSRTHRSPLRPFRKRETANCKDMPFKNWVM